MKRVVGARRYAWPVKASMVEVERYFVVTRLASTTPSVSNLDARNCAAPGGSRGSWSRPGDLRQLEAGFWNQNDLRGGDL